MLNEQETNREMDQVQRLARIEAIVEDMHHRLFGNGQPGEVQTIKDDVSSLKSSRSWVKGGIAVLGFLVGADGIAHIRSFFK